MPTNKWLIVVATGELVTGGFSDPALPVLSVTNGVTAYDPAYAVVTLPTEAMPNVLTQRWNGSAVVAKTSTELQDGNRKAVDATLDVEDCRVISAIVDEFKAAGLLGSVNAGFLKTKIHTRVRASLRAAKGV